MRSSKTMRWMSGPILALAVIGLLFAGIAAGFPGRPLAGPQDGPDPVAADLRLDARQLGELAAGDAVELDLLPDMRVTALIDSVRRDTPSTFQLVGGIDGDPDGTVIVVSRDGMVSALVRSPVWGNAIVLPQRVGAQRAHRLDPEAVPPCGVAEEHVIDAAAIGGIAGGGGVAGGDVTVCGAVRIDVLVVYSPEARAAAGGTTAMQSVIDLAMADVNLSYIRSNVGQRVRLVGTLELLQSESGSFFTDLARLRNIGDGFYDEVHAERDTLGADMVAMLIDDTSLGGLAYLQAPPDPAFESQAFSVTNWFWASFSVLAHELGHNMGCAHDRQNASGGAFSYSFGDRVNGDSGVLWRTVMAYAPGQRIQNFSNPDVLFDGQPTGVPIGDPLETHNAASLDGTSVIVAGFRIAIDGGGGGGMASEGDVLVASDPGAGELFGISVAVSGDLAVVGALFDDEMGLLAGAAYVYRYDGIAWNFEQKLIGSDTDAGDRFGRAVAVDDGTILVGAVFGDYTDPDENFFPDCGAAYVFDFDGLGWVETDVLAADVRTSGDQFGSALDIDGNVAIIGAPIDDNERGLDAGAAYVFRRDLDVWSLEDRVLASDGQPFDGFGFSVAINDDAAIVGSWMDDSTVLDAGSAYVLRYDGVMDWNEEQKLEVAGPAEDDQLGYSVAITDEIVVVGAWQEEDSMITEDAGAAYVFRYDAKLNSWEFEQRLTAADATADDRFGTSVAASADVILVGASTDDLVDDMAMPVMDAGSAYVFRLGGSFWNEQAKITKSDPMADEQFGFEVDLDGEVSIIGAPNVEAGTGAAFISEGVAFLDCNINGIPDDCDIINGDSTDCNGNDVPDDCDISEGFSADIDANGVPDECEDCDGNGNPDSLDIAVDPPALDCNDNGELDSCEVIVPITATSPVYSPIGGLAPGQLIIPSAPNTVNDVTITLAASAEIAGAGQFITVRLNGVTVGGTTAYSTPGFTDCAAPPEIDVLTVPAATYNGLLTGGDAVFDFQPTLTVSDTACDGLSTLQVTIEYTVPSLSDLNANGLVDDCEDCNGNMVPDFIDIATGFSFDCNENNVPDDCESLADCNLDMTPDECEIREDPGLDCNANGVLDSCDIASGDSSDINGNGTPDECEPNFCAPDCANPTDGNVDTVDLLALVAQWGQPGSCDIRPEPIPNGVVDTQDLLALLAAWGACF